MADEGSSILKSTLAVLSREFGEPVCRGDCCWWTLSREGRRPVRVSVFIDGESRRAEGWLCDLQDPETTIDHFVVNREHEIPALVDRIHALVGAQHEPSEVDASDAPRQPTTGR